MAAPSRWRVGETVAGVYELTAANRSGLVATVFQARHRDWGVDLAVKVPYPSAGVAMDVFETEARMWMELDLHPNVVSCVYVRRLDGIPVVFTEWIDGGTLRRLVGAVDVAVPEGLAQWADVGIQASRGVDHAHASGLAHRDVKPDNLMLGGDGTVRVTDFGSANLMAGSGSPEAGGDWRYCSPEQQAAIAGRESDIGPATDSWSWAATMVELALGGRPWGDDVPDPVAISAALRNSRLPHGIIALLEACLDPVPGARPGLPESEATLRRFWEERSGVPYPRKASLPDAVTAEWLSNRALSYGDLGENDKATEMLQAALRADPHNVYAVYNNGLGAWRTGQFSDEAFLAEVETAQQFNATWHGEVLIGLVHLERGDTDKAREHLDRARSSSPDAAESRPLAEALERLADATTIVRLDRRQSDVTALAPDGSNVLIGGADGSLELWDVDSGRLRTRLRDNGPEVLAVSVGPDAAVMAALYGDDSFELWTASDQPPAHYRWPGAQSLALSACGRFLAIGDRHGFITVTGTADDTTLSSWQAHGGPVHELRLSEEAEVCTSASFHEDPVPGDGTVTIWSARDGVQMASVPYPGTGPGMKWRRSEVAFDRHAAALALCPVGTVTVFDTFELERISYFDRNDLGRGDLRALHAPTGLGFYAHDSGANAFLDVVAGRIATTTRPQEYQDQHARCVRAEFTGDGTKVVSVESFAVGTARQVRVLPTGPLRFEAPTAYSPPKRTEQLIREAAVFDALLTRAEDLVRGGDEAGAARTLREARLIAGRQRDPRLRSAWRTLRGHRRLTSLLGMWQAGSMKFSHSNQPAVAISPSGDLVTVAELNVHVRIAPFDRLAESQRLAELSGSAPAAIRSLAFTEDENAVVALFEGQQARPYFLPGRPVPSSIQLSPTSFPLSDIAFHTGLTAVAEPVDGDVQSRCRVVLYAGTGAWTPPELYLQPDVAISGNLLLIADVISLTAWDIGTRTKTYTVDIHRSGGVHPAIAPDGSRMALQSSGGFKVIDVASGFTVFANDSPVWDPETGPTLSDGRFVESMAFSPDARFLVVGRSDGHLDMWDVEAAACVWTARAHGAHVTYVAGNRDFSRLITRDWYGVLLLWELEWDCDI